MLLELLLLLLLFKLLLVLPPILLLMQLLRAPAAGAQVAADPDADTAVHCAHAAA
jgi:hypothetical protein